MIDKILVLAKQVEMFEKWNDEFMLTQMKRENNRRDVRLPCEKC